AGRPVVLATTTPYDFVAPLAERLSFDDVVATRYAERDGVYTGALDGEFVWGRGKLSAVRRWAEGRGVELAQSWAYSDSVFDVPLLSAVGHPCAVNPDLRLQAVAVTVARTGRAIRFLGKAEVFDAPVVGQLARALGGIRVERGSGSDEPLRAAAQALEAGELVALMPQGTIPRGRDFFDPELKG